MARHRVSLTRTQVVGIVAASALSTAAVGWLVSSVLDRGVELLNDRGQLAADLTGTFAVDFAVPTEQADRWPSGEGSWNEAEYGPYSEYMSRVSSLAGGGPGASSLQVTTSGLSDEAPVIIEGISAVNVTCLDAGTAGRWQRIVDEGGGSFVALPVEIDLDDASEVAGVPTPAYDPNGTVPVRWEFPRQVSRDQAERFLLNVSTTEDRRCTYDLQFEYSVRGERDTHVIDRDFAVVGDSVGADAPLQPLY